MTALLAGGVHKVKVFLGSKCLRSIYRWHGKTLCRKETRRTVFKNGTRALVEFTDGRMEWCDI